LKDIQIPSDAQLRKGVVIIECVEEIPCNPCVAVCPAHAISMKDINALPRVDFEKCTGCTKCVGICPGLAIFVVKVTGDNALVTLPYEFLPLPKVGDIVDAVDREGKVRGDVKVVRINSRGNTAVVTVQVEKALAMDVRMIRVRS
jgi:Fe-S-cluster-containing hydrogenase component 2